MVLNDIAPMGWYRPYGHKTVRCQHCALKLLILRSLPGFRSFRPVEEPPLPSSNWTTRCVSLSKPHAALSTDVRKDTSRSTSRALWPFAPGNQISLSDRKRCTVRVRRSTSVSTVYFHVLGMLSSWSPGRENGATPQGQSESVWSWVGTKGGRRRMSCLRYHGTTWAIFSSVSGLTSSS